MGKYNFSATRFAEIEKKIAELEMKCSNLEAENAALKAGRIASTKRSLLLELGNYEKVKELFGYDPSSGELKTTENREKIGSNFHTFHTNIIRAIKPCIRKSVSKSCPYRIVGTPPNELDDKEWKIVVETIETIVDTIHYAKQKMKDENIKKG